MPTLKRKANDSTASLKPTKKARSPIILSLCNKIKLAQQRDKFFNGAETIISKEVLLNPWLTRNMVYGRIRRMKLKEKKELEGLIKQNTSTISNTISNTLTIYNSNNSGGRPEGSTIKMIETTNNLKEKATDEIVILYAQERQANNGHIKRGSYKRIHDSVIEKLSIVDKTFEVNVRSI